MVNNGKAQINTLNLQHETPIDLAKKNEAHDCLFYLEGLQEKLNEELIVAVINSKDISIIKNLLMKGAKISCANNDGNTPLHLALLVDHLEIAHVLLDLCADVYKTNKKGKSVLDLLYEDKIQFASFLTKIEEKK